MNNLGTYKGLFIFLFCFISGRALSGQNQSDSSRKKESEIPVEKIKILTPSGAHTVDETGPFNDAEDKGNKTVDSPDIGPAFPGGKTKWKEYASSHFSDSLNCDSGKMSGELILKFIIDVQGRISDISVVRDSTNCQGFRDEALRVLRTSPPWIPAQQRGRFVQAYGQVVFTRGPN